MISVVALADGRAAGANEQAVGLQLAHHKLDAGHLFQTYAESARARY